MSDIQDLMKMLQSDNPNKRYEACEELRVSPFIPPEALEALRSVTSDKNSDVADAAHRAIKIHTPTSSTQNKEEEKIIPVNKEKTSATVTEGISQLLFLASLILFVSTLNVESRMGGWSLFIYIFFLPALILFVVVGSFAARRLTEFANTFYHENVALTVISVLGILFLILTIRPEDTLYGPWQMNGEHITQDIFMYVIPCGIGLTISRSFFILKRKTRIN